MKHQCAVCRKQPHELPEYRDLMIQGEYETELEAMLEEEGTYNAANGLFCCTRCYVRIGGPSTAGGWKPTGLIDIKVMPKETR